MLSNPIPFCMFAACRAFMSLLLVGLLTQATLASQVLTIFSHNSDGAVYGAGNFPTQNLIVGFSTGSQEYSGIAIFELPDRKGFPLLDASLKLTVVDSDTPTANFDIWGLGYRTGTPTLNSAWRWTSDTETRNGNTLDTNIGTDLPVKIADNFVTANTLVPNGPISTNTVQNTNLLAFLNSLYDDYGAQAGDYAIIRINADATNSPDVRFGGSHTGANAAQLNVTIAPEPSAWLLAMMAGLVMIPVVRRLRRRVR